MTDNISQLEARIKKLEETLMKREKNQVQYPLDPISKDVLSILPKGKVVIPQQIVNVVGGGGGSVTIPSQTVTVTT